MSDVPRWTSPQVSQVVLMVVIVPNSGSQPLNGHRQERDWVKDYSMHSHPVATVLISRVASGYAFPEVNQSLANGGSGFEFGIGT